MARLSRLDLYPFFYSDHDLFLHRADLLFLPEPIPQLDVLGVLSDLYQIEASTSFHRTRFLPRTTPDPFLLSLLDRVTALEHRFERTWRRDVKGDRKYEWTAEIEGKDADGKHKLKAEIIPWKEKGGESFKWVTEVKEKGKGGERTYTWTESYGGEGKKHKKEKKDKEKKGLEYRTRLVEIEEPADDRESTMRMMKIMIKRRRGKTQKPRQPNSIISIPCISHSTLCTMFVIKQTHRQTDKG